MPADDYQFVVQAFNWVGQSTNSPALTVTLPLKVDTLSAIVTGTGLTTVAASVAALVEVASYDELGTARTTGGDLFYIHVVDRCSVTSNFYCEENSLSTKVLYPPIMKLMTDNGDGTYSVSYSARRDGLGTVEVFALN